MNKIWGNHISDRFASTLTSKCKKYNSIHADPYTSGIDASLQIEWGIENNTEKYVNCISNLSIQSTTNEPKIKMVRLEDFRLEKLSANNWPLKVSCLYIHFIAQSTLEQYNSYMTRYRKYCLDNLYPFSPLGEHRQASVVSFLHVLASSYQRPQSLYKIGWSVLINCWWCRNRIN